MSTVRSRLGRGPTRVNSTRRFFRVNVIGSLRLFNISFADSGVYECTASNVHGQESARGAIAVLGNHARLGRVVGTHTHYANAVFRRRAGTVSGRPFRELGVQRGLLGSGPSGERHDRFVVRHWRQSHESGKVDEAVQVPGRRGPGRGQIGGRFREDFGERPETRTSRAQSQSDRK